MSAGRAKTLEEWRHEYRDNKALWGRNRGWSRCMFCNSYTCGQWCIPGVDKTICDACLTGEIVQDRAQPQAVAVPGEIIDIPYARTTKKVKVTVQVHTNWGDGDDFDLVHESNIWKTDGDHALPRRSYFVKQCAHVTIGIRNVEAEALTLQITHVDENLDPGDMKTVIIEPRGVFEFSLERAHGEDRECLKICDIAGKLSLMLSFQEELPVMSRKRSRVGGSAGEVVDPTNELDMHLRSLCLLGQAL